MKHTLIVDAQGNKCILEDGKQRPYRWYHALVDAVSDRWYSRDWSRRQRLAQLNGGARFYGDGGTIHGSAYLDVEIHRGKVVAVWFRCQPLPFKEVIVKQDRARSMKQMMSGCTTELRGVEVRDTPR